jgi:thiol-disulfide isomerase/thioredoxin
MNPLLEGKKVNELYMIDTVYAREVRKMGFDTTSSAKSITDLYYKNQAKLAPMFRTLYQINAKYTILLFWAADCGHCQKEVPKLHESLKALKGKIDVKVFAVQTKDDLFEDWRKFLIKNKISDFINVFDPVHINDVKTKFDVTSTPLIYVLDKDKKIIAKKIASEYVADLLKELEKQNVKP